MLASSLQVREDTDEYKLVQYKLQLALRSTAITNLRVTAFSDPLLSESFQQHSSGKLVLDGWLSESQLDQGGAMVFEPSVDVQVGNIRLDDGSSAARGGGGGATSNGASSSSSSSSHDLLLATICVRRAHAASAVRADDDAGHATPLPSADLSAGVGPTPFRARCM